MAATITDSVGLKGKNNDADVRTIQDMLDLTPNGNCGTGVASEELIAAIKLFQQAVVGFTGKSIDGLISPGGKTLQALVKADFKRWAMVSPSVLTDADIEAGAAALNLEVALVQTVADVETMGSGFLASGKPRILFERHRFHALTGGKYAAKHPNISQLTPGGYGAVGENQYARLYEAMACDREAALKSASWGRFQIMGESYKWAGFSHVDDFVDAMRESEQRHLTAFFNFIRNKGCIKYLKKKLWTPFAVCYNGDNEATQNARGAYHDLLEKSYNKIILQKAEMVSQFADWA